MNWWFDLRCNWGRRRRLGKDFSCWDWTRVDQQTDRIGSVDCGRNIGTIRIGRRRWASLPSTAVDWIRDNICRTTDRTCCAHIDNGHWRRRRWRWHKKRRGHDNGIGHRLKCLWLNRKDVGIANDRVVVVVGLRLKRHRCCCWLVDGRMRIGRCSSDRRWVIAFFAIEDARNGPMWNRLIEVTTLASLMHCHPVVRWWVTCALRLLPMGPISNKTKCKSLRCRCGTSVSPPSAPFRTFWWSTRKRRGNNNNKRCQVGGWVVFYLWMHSASLTA